MLHWIFKVFPFMSQNNIEVDELHVLYLGTIPMTLGSVRWTLCYNGLVGAPANNVGKVWAHVCHYYSTHKVETRFSSLSLASFTNPERPRQNYPKLKGSGSEVKDL